MSHTVVIVGAGFSGIVTFYRLLNSTQHIYNRIVLVDDGKVGGLAYGQQDDLHRLNVPAGRMSALIEDDDHFLKFASYVSPIVHASDFVSRSVYGAYLRWMLETSKRKAAAGKKTLCIKDRVVDICIGRNGAARVVLQSGKSLSARKVIIATGNQHGPSSKLALPDLGDSPRYLAHPWPASALRQLDTTRPLLLIGSGLTAVDIAMSLHRRRPEQPVIMLSRHGLLPQAHRGLSWKLEVEVNFRAIIETPRRIRSLLRALRDEVRTVESRGGDWRDVVAALRDDTPALWQQLPVVERKRFLRHGRAYWDAHRHRLPPDIAEKLQQLLQQGLLRIEAGRITSVHDSGHEVVVNFQRRGSAQHTRMVVGAVIDCTGPETRIAHTGNVLLQSLQKRGLISEDVLQLGIRVASNYAVLDANGRASDVIHYVGPWLRAHHWEATAVPELRVHAARLVDALCIDQTSRAADVTAGRKASDGDAEYCG